MGRDRSTIGDRSSGQQQNWLGWSSMGRYVNRESVMLPIAAIFLLTVLLVTPQGEFPLNDDWIHAKAVQRLLEEGSYRGHPYVAATLVAQANWAALFAKIFGFSFTTLRISTLVLAVIGAWAVAWSALAMGIRRNLALLCGVLFAFNPIMLTLSYSFMTDVPFVSLSALSGLGFLKFLRSRRAAGSGARSLRVAAFGGSGRVGWVLFGSAFAAIGFFVRQFAIVPAAAFAVTLVILWWRSRIRVNWGTIGAFVAPWATAAVLYVWFLSVKESGTALFTESRPLAMTVIEAVRHFPIALTYMGLFAFPIGLGLLWQIKQQEICWSRKRTIALAGMSGLFLIIFALPKLLNTLREILTGSRTSWLDAYPHRMPLLALNYFSTYLNDLSLGNSQLPNGFPHPLIQIGAVWWIFTIAAVVTTGLFLVFCVPFVRNIVLQRTDQFGEKSIGEKSIADHQRLFLLLWLLFALVIVYNPWRPNVFDRLLLAGLQPFLLILAYEFNQHRDRAAMNLAIAGTAIIYLFSLVGVQDYLAWNRTAWDAQNKLMQTYSVSPEQIRGADTFNGWYNSDKYMEKYNTKDFWQANLTGLGPWTFDNSYVVTSEETLKGYEAIDRLPYFTWLGMQNRYITIFKRNDVSAMR
ncbi:ArnT family glycosyltransferase [Leptolyngbya ohadii]|uniref:ArnT family glycosyltransferase n=1 Tax=Leptolyngbya ohadii TaxID=1962290 RepID=UPI000B5998DB|nr:glycosyltransferase family 39 protein [Leptolyngbya ohadii]